MSHSLIVLPDDSVRCVLDAIDGATTSLRIKMFVFSDPELLNAVIAAQRRGVKVRVMLNPVRRGGESENQETRATLTDGGVEVLDSNPAFQVTHEKSMVIDDAHAFVESLNWETENFAETRDYAVVTSRDVEVREIIDCFEADWYRQSFDPGQFAHLIWCPTNGRDRLAAFIDRADHVLFIQNERYQDPIIIERLVRAARRGVKLHVMARPPHALKEEKLLEGVGGLRILDDVGAKIHKLKHLRLHAKMILADGVRGIIGSINFAPGSFDDRRELAIEVRHDDVIERLQRVARYDWDNSYPLDLSDEGLRADLEDHSTDSVHKLALQGNDHAEDTHEK